jgi:hypothetical protein
LNAIAIVSKDSRGGWQHLNTKEKKIERRKNLCHQTKRNNSAMTSLPCGELSQK